MERAKITTSQASRKTNWRDRAFLVGHMVAAVPGHIKSVAAALKFHSKEIGCFEAISCVAALAFLSSCAGEPSLVGYLRNDTTAVTQAPGSTGIHTEAVVLRRDENLLDLSLYGPARTGTLTSIHSSDFALIIRFTTDLMLPPADPEIFVPVLTSKHISVVRTYVTKSQHEVALELSADRLGIDLVLAALAAPGGIRGVAYFPSLGLGIPLEGQAYRPEFAWGQLYVRRGSFGHQCLGYKNINEYPFRIWTVSAPNLRPHAVKIKVDPFRMKWSCSSSFDSIDAAQLQVSAERMKTAPNKYLRPYLKDQ
jgi:hypothetical protein